MDAIELCHDLYGVMSAGMRTSLSLDTYWPALGALSDGAFHQHRRHFVDSWRQECVRTFPYYAQVAQHPRVPTL